MYKHPARPSDVEALQRLRRRGYACTYDDFDRFLVNRGDAAYVLHQAMVSHPDELDVMDAVAKHVERTQVTRLDVCEIAEELGLGGRDAPWCAWLDAALARHRTAMSAIAVMSAMSVVVMAAGTPVGTPA